MDEYIKREDALDAVLFALSGTGYQSTAILAIRDIPTADVVPKSEVERLNKKIDVLKRDRYQVFPDGRFELLPITDLDKIKAEVAREVAYDFQNRLRHIFLDMCNYNDYETLNLLQIDSAIEALYDTFSPELEKKYTEGAK